MLLDTSGLLSLHDARDKFHSDAVRLYREADRLITHNYVLAELVALVNARNLPRAKALRYIADLLDHPLIEVLWVDESFHRAAMRLLERRLDKADCAFGDPGAPRRRGEPAARQCRTIAHGHLNLHLHLQRAGIDDVGAFMVA